MDELPKRPKWLKNADFVSMEVTLHAELLHTRLADFVEHFERDFARYIKYLDIKGIIAIRWNDDPVSDPARATNSFLSLAGSGMPLTVIRARTEIKGNTERNYIVFINDGRGLADFRGHLFTLSAVQFRRDRLKIVMTEYTTTSRIHAKNMREWLEPRWGKVGKEGDLGIGVVDLNPEDAPKAKHVLDLPEVPPTAGTDGATRDDVFDWYYRGGKLYIPELQDLHSYLCLAKSSVYNIHGDYKALYGVHPKPDSESRFVGMTPSIPGGE